MQRSAPSSAIMQLVAATALASAVGCAGTQMPNWAHPGPAGYQRHNALQFDPYPSDDLGPPTGTRPPEYSREIPEAKRIQKFASPPANVRPLSMPSFSMPAVVAPPPTGAPAAAPAPVFPSRAPY